MKTEQHCDQVGHLVADQDERKYLHSKYSKISHHAMQPKIMRYHVLTFKLANYYYFFNHNLCQGGFWGSSIEMMSW